VYQKHGFQSIDGLSKNQLFPEKFIRKFSLFCIKQDFSNFSFDFSEKGFPFVQN